VGALNLGGGLDPVYAVNVAELAIEKGASIKQLPIRDASLMSRRGHGCAADPLSMTA
jgi:hypothetical protein